MANLLDAIIKFIGNRGVFLDGENNINAPNSLFLKNNRGVYIKDANGIDRTAVALSSANNLGFGYGLYDNNVGETRIYGNNVGLYSKNTITANKGMSITGNTSITGNLTTTGSITTGGNVNGRNVQKLIYRGDIETTSHTLANYQTSPITLAANTDSDAKVATITKSGYYPYAIAGYNVTGTNRMYQNVYECLLTDRANGSAEVTYRFFNNANTQVSVGFVIHVMWVKIL